MIIKLVMVLGDVFYADESEMPVVYQLVCDYSKAWRTESEEVSLEAQRAKEY